MSVEGSTALRKYAQRHYPLGTCACGKPGCERHHPDPQDRKRVVGLCRACHWRADWPHGQPRDARGRFAMA